MIKLLDCTLRDGGYINNWNFGHANIKKIINNLTDANIDLIECGFLEDVEYHIDRSFFSDVSQIESVIPRERRNSNYIAMTRFGNLNINNLKAYDGRSINGIRVTFHIHEVDEALEYCRQVKEKGYNVYVQPVGTTSYTDEALLSLIKIVNKLSPYAFYIVDTLGVMKKRDIRRMFYLVDNNLSKEICVGFHSHNNLQLSFSNSQELALIHSTRHILLDSSVHGMGRGAGNLNTELIAQFINTNIVDKYNIESLLNIVDEYIVTLKSEYSWGYSMPYYLAAIHNSHPDYATYLINKKTLEVSSIGKILNRIPHERREIFDAKLVEQLYYDFQKHTIDDMTDREELEKVLTKHEVLIIAPGNSLISHKQKVKEYVSKNNPIVISVNFITNDFKTKYVFFSNKRRFSSIMDSSIIKSRGFELLVTSNIEQQKEISNYIINYSDYLNDYSYVQDNAMLLLLKFLKSIGCRNISIAGFDGYQIGEHDNYFLDNMETKLDKDIYHKMNEEISNFIKCFNNDIPINFLTPSKYVE